MRAKILHFQTAAATQLPLNAGAAMIQAAGRLARRRCHDESTAVTAWQRAGRRHSQWIRQAECRQSRGPIALKNGTPWRIRVQEGIAVSLIGVVIDAGAASEYG